VTEDPPKRVPSGAELVSVGVDVGKHLCHWVAVAWRPDGSPHVIEYGRLEVPKVILVGEGYEGVQLPGGGGVLIEANADHWKSFVHARLQTPVGHPGAMTLHQGTPGDHLAISKHFTSEKKEEEFVAGRGTVVRWRKVHRNNHWLDAAYLACVAGYGVGERLIGASIPDAPAAAAKTDEKTKNPLTSHRGKW
jgi:hypothetical protein